MPVPKKAFDKNKNTKSRGRDFFCKPEILLHFEIKSKEHAFTKKGIQLSGI